MPSSDCHLKGFVFLQGSEIALRFFHENTLSELEKKHELVYVILKPTSKKRKDAGIDEVVRLLSDEGAKIEWIDHLPNRAREWEKLFHISSIHFEKKSSSFAVRHEEDYQHRKDYKGVYLKHAKHGAYETYRGNVEKSLGLNPNITKVVLRHRPDFFVLPSTLQDRLTDDVMQISDKLNIPTLLLLAGWDNLSSKGILHVKPSMTGVFGQQTKEHAIAVQGIGEEQIEIVGAPHYDRYKADCWNRHECRKDLGFANENIPLVLFAGTFRLFDETVILRELEEAIDKGILPPMKIIYRPHPQRTKRDDEASFFDYKWSHVEFDPEMEEFYASHKNGTDVVPKNYFERMSYLPKLYSSIDAVICPLSSVMLESIMFGVPVMAIAFGDGKHSWSADKVSRMLHFKEFYDIPELLVCRDRERFIKMTEELFEKIDDKNISESLVKSSGYFVLQNQHSYGERVLNALEKMLSRSRSKPNYESANLKLYSMKEWLKSIVKKIMKTPVNS